MARLPDVPLTTLVEFQIREENNNMGEWLSAWEPRGRDAMLGEPETTGYEACTNLEQPSQVMIYERYERGGRSLRAHMQRKAHRELNQAMGARRMTKRRVFSGLVFADIPGAGYWGRERRELTEKQRRRGTLLFILAFRFREEWMRDKWTEIMTQLAEWDRENEPGTLTYAGGIVAADLPKMNIKKGDFVWVSEFADRRAMEEHQVEPHHVAVGKAAQDAGVVWETVWTGAYRTTGRGFMSRTAGMPAADPAFDGSTSAKL